MTTTKNQTHASERPISSSVAEAVRYLQTHISTVLTYNNIQKFCLNAVNFAHLNFWMSKYFDSRPQIDDTFLLKG